jgi:hypothetical protein
MKMTAQEKVKRKKRKGFRMLDGIAKLDPERCERHLPTKWEREYDVAVIVSKKEARKWR